MIYAMRHAISITILFFSDWLDDAVCFCSEVRVEGLETLDYFDNLLQRERYTEQADAITFDGEVMCLILLLFFLSGK